MISLFSGYSYLLSPGIWGPIQLSSLKALFLNDSGLEDVDAGLDDVKLDESFVSVFLIGDHVQSGPMQAVHIANAT